MSKKSNIKMKKIRVFAIALIGSFVGLSASAQDTRTDNHDVTITIPEVALLDLEVASGSKNITLAATAPTEAGNAVSFATATNSTLWMNYSSIKRTGTDPSRKVTVAITGTVPAGTVLKVVGATDAAGGAGTVGTPTAAVTLSSTSQDFITGIGSAYTGTGASKGHNLTYSLELAAAAGSYALLDAANSGTVTVTYTLSDN
jgi:hypothetical protein